MAHTQEVIEVTLMVTVADESSAVTVAEVLSRTMIGLSAEAAYASLSVDRYQQVCHDVHDEVGP